MNYINECTLQGISNNTVYVIYTNDGPYDTAPTYEAAVELAELYGLQDYTIVEEQIYIYINNIHGTTHCLMCYEYTFTTNVNHFTHKCQLYIYFTLTLHFTLSNLSNIIRRISTISFIRHKTTLHVKFLF